METKIQEKLAEIELKHGVTIVYACESGSRAWGFPSQNSDYDVRFIYAHPIKWYLSIAERRDVIEVAVDDVLDINGWDIRKSLRLMRKSNSPLNEWLSSPIRYRCPGWAARPLFDLAREAFLPESSAHHYLAMARSGLNKARKKNTVAIKNYLYTIRTLLCCRWIAVHRCQPPMRILQMMHAPDSPSDETLYGYIEDLIHLRAESQETAAIPRSRWFEAYIDGQLDLLGMSIPKNPDKLGVDVFDRVFRHILDGVEGVKATENRK